MKASCEMPAAQLEDGFLMLHPLVADKLGVCRADGLAFRVELEFLGFSDVAEETDVTGAYMRSVETFPSVAACEQALAALRAAVDVLYPDIHGLYPYGTFSATRTSRLEKNRQGASSAYVQTVALAIAGRAFVLENRFVLAGE